MVEWLCAGSERSGERGHGISSLELVCICRCWLAMLACCCVFVGLLLSVARVEILAFQVGAAFSQQ